MGVDNYPWVLVGKPRHGAKALWSSPPLLLTGYLLTTGCASDRSADSWENFSGLAGSGWTPSPVAHLSRSPTPVAANPAT